MPAPARDPLLISRSQRTARSAAIVWFFALQTQTKQAEDQKICLSQNAACRASSTNELDKGSVSRASEDACSECLPGQFWSMRVLSVILLFVPAVLTAQAAQMDLERQIEHQIEQTFEELDHAEAARLLRSQGSTEQQKGMKWILFPERFAAKPGPNLALSLLLHILKTRPVPAGDTMPIALALAYNYNYAAGNHEVRKALKADIIAHYDFYRVVAEWQKKHARYAALDKSPIIAQTYWASRDRSAYETRTKDIYDLRLPAIRHLMRLHTLLAEQKAIGGRSAFELAYSIQFYYRSKRLAAPLLTGELRTYAAGPLLAFHERKGLFAAENCVSDATNLGVLFQAMGLAPLFYYQNFQSAGSKGINHEWPAVYDLESRRFMTAQKGNPWPSHPERETPVDFEIFRPMWHHAWMEQGLEEEQTMPAEERAPPAHIGGRLRRNSHGERTTSGAMRDFVLQGITEEEMEELWTIPVWKKSREGLFTVQHKGP